MLEINQDFLNEESYDDDEFLIHYGMPRRSGRYPWGSGDNPFAHDKFRDSVSILREQGFSDKMIAEEFNMTSREFRNLVTITKEEQKQENYRRYTELKNKGYSRQEIADKLGVNESTVRGWETQMEGPKKAKVQELAEQLKDLVDQGNYIDVGSGVELYLNCSKERLSAAVDLLKSEYGYSVEVPTVTQVGTGKQTSVKVIAPPGTTWGEIMQNKNKISQIPSVQELFNGDANTSGDVQIGAKPVKKIDPSRVFIRYSDEGGKSKDGVIEIRPGVEDLTLGNSKYAQVRIGLEGDMYLKGMALYSNRIPEGYDIVFNSHEPSGTPPEKVFKKMKTIMDKETGKEIVNEGNPFGASYKQLVDPNTKEIISACNIVNDEGTWDTWSKSLSSQFLSKQNLKLIKQQLNLGYEEKLAEYDTIMSLTNNAVKRKLLEEFADNCDSAAVDLKAAALPRQAQRVLLPVDELKPGEIYAPGYIDGEIVALVRHPHGGTFEIPLLKVNNKNKDAIEIIGPDTKDAVGINSQDAGKLSGADYDGDSAIVIPCNSSYSDVKIDSIPDSKMSKSLLELQNFDTGIYKVPDDQVYNATTNPKGVKLMTKRARGQEMGKITNLITDMSIMGATQDELARSVKYSMVVIDAYKHGLDYRKAYDDFDVANLYIKYRGGVNKGAGTIISRASSEKHINERKEGQYVPTGEYKEIPIINPETGELEGYEKKEKLKIQYYDPETGKKLYRETGRTKSVPVTDKDGNIVDWKKEPIKMVSTKMYEAEDAYELTSGGREKSYEVEKLYADYANNLKSLGNQARLSYLNTPPIKVDPNAKKEYSEEIKSLSDKLKKAQLNAPKERQAQVIANEIIKQQFNELGGSKNIDDDEKKKIKNNALARGREITGAGKDYIPLTEREFEAMNACAISEASIQTILTNTKPEVYKSLAMPKNSATSLTENQIRLIKSKVSQGFSYAEIANSLGISQSTVSNYAKPANDLV